MASENQSIQSINQSIYCLRDPTFSRLGRTLTWQTDRQTDRRTHGHSMYRTIMASRGKNHYVCVSWPH